VTDVDGPSYTGKAVVVSTVDTGNKEVTTGETLTEGVDVVLAGPFIIFNMVYINKLSFSGLMILI
jgi:superfamily II DNA/RNA helicase